jgi:phasin
MLQRAIKGPRWEPIGARRYTGDGLSSIGFKKWANGEAGLWMVPANEKRSGTMSEEGRDRFEIPKDMRSMAEASVDQARKALEKFLSGAQATAGSIEERGATVRAGAKDIGAKAISYAEQNVQASLDYAQSLLHAEDLNEVMRLHTTYVQAQMRSLAEQASEMGQIVSRAAMDAAKPKS